MEIETNTVIQEADDYMWYMQHFIVADDRCTMTVLTGAWLLFTAQPADSAALTCQSNHISVFWAALIVRWVRLTTVWFIPD